MNEEKEDDVLVFEEAYSDGGPLLKQVGENMSFRKTRYLYNVKIELWRLLNCKEKKEKDTLERWKQACVDRFHSL
jgi:hypothetical protein